MKNKFHLLDQNPREPGQNKPDFPEGPSDRPHLPTDPNKQPID